MSHLATTGLRLAAAGAAAALALAVASPASAQESRMVLPESSFSYLQQELPAGGFFERVVVQPQFRVDFESPVEAPAGVLLTFTDTMSQEAFASGTFEETNSALVRGVYDNCRTYGPRPKIYGIKCFVPYDVEAGKTYALSGPISYDFVTRTPTDDDAGLYYAEDIGAIDFEGFSQLYNYDPANDRNLTFVETTEVEGGNYSGDHGLFDFQVQ
jgi:hypothetical protein